MNDQTQNEAIIARARERHAGEGLLEIDDNAEVLVVDDPPGAWVQAWVWVDNEEGQS